MEYTEKYQRLISSKGDEFSFFVSPAKFERGVVQKVRFHRDDGQPAKKYHGTDHLEWWVDGHKHRGGDLPAVQRTKIVHNKDNHSVVADAYTEEWWFKGFRHRNNNKPAITVTDTTSGDILLEMYFYKGNLHRVDGPAIIAAPVFSQTSETYAEFWLNDVIHTPHEFFISKEFFMDIDIDVEIPDYRDEYVEFLMTNNYHIGDKAYASIRSSFSQFYSGTDASGFNSINGVYDI